jgi:ABC-2 type transport system ATP-binding protein
MSPVISVRGVSKHYGKKIALDNIDLTIEPGKIVGLIGPNGAGKTSLLKGILGLAPVEGELTVLGMNPQRERVKLLERVSFIADTAILPSWIKVSELITYTEGVHPRFSRAQCVKYLAETSIALTDKVRTLSKGTVTQLHLALIMAIDSELLVLDEPTLGLDIIYRRQFYENLLNDYYDGQKNYSDHYASSRRNRNYFNRLGVYQSGKNCISREYGACRSNLSGVASGG